MWKAAGCCGVTGPDLAAAPPVEAKIIKGDWWPADYSGPPLLSVTDEMAEDFGLSVGDTVSLNILGREITGG